MQPVVAVLLWIGVGVAVFRRPKDSLTVLCIVMFFTMFVPFAILQLGAPRLQLPTDSSQLWYWVDRTMLPAMLLTASVLNRLLERSKRTVTER
jgi:hypothetical protein